MTEQNKKVWIFILSFLLGVATTIVSIRMNYGYWFV